MSPSYTRDYPLVIARGEGAVVEDVDGNRFLDCAAGIAVNSTGVSHPEVVKAIADQAREVHPHVGHGLLLRAAGAARGGAGGDRADRRATCGRSSATPAPRRPRRRSSCRAITRSGPDIIAFLGSFHGRSLGLAGADRRARSIQRRGFGPLMPGVYHAPYPDTVSLQRQRRRVRRGVARRSSAIRSSCTSISPDEVAAIVVEPIQGEGGYIVAADGVPAGAARADDEARHPARARRSAVGHGPDGEDVRHRALRRRRPTSSTSRRASRRACRSASPARAPTSWTGRPARTRARSAATRSRAPPRSRRSSCCSEQLVAERRDGRRVPDGRAARRCRTSTRSSATCAARA